MKKLFLTLFPLIAFVSALAQETKSELKTRFDVIRNETVTGANTKTRLANAFQELADGSQSVFYLVASGTDTYTATALNLDAYAGKYFVVQFPNANTGSATLNINSLGAVTLKKDGNINLIADDIDAGSIHILAYDGANFEVLTALNTIPLSTHVTGRLAYTNLTQGSALSVLGVSGNAVADHASIAAGSDFQVLRRSGTAIGFGSVALNQSAAVTGTLPIANGGTGSLNGTGLVISTKTGAYTITTSDLAILCNATTAAFTVTLPTAASASGYEFVVKKIDSSVNAVTVDPNGAELIDGAATYALSAQWKYVRFKSNGTAWYIIANN